MRRFKTIMFAIFSTALVALFGFEVLAAVYLNITIHGDVEYYATEIGASIWGTYSYNPEGDTGTARYLTLSGGGGSVTNDVYEVTGNETSYSNISANIGNTIFTSLDDTITLYVFIKNTGDRYIIPNVSVSFTDTTHLTSIAQYTFFDISAGNADPLTLKQNAVSASAFISDVDDEIEAEHCYVFNSNSSIDNDDVYVAKITISLQNASGDGNLAINASFDVHISFMADVQYTANDILSIYQTQNITDPNWTKFGYNATLSATSTKVEENNLTNLYTYLYDADANGNAHITHGQDDYQTAIVYKDIDLVNVDITTGEIIGKLSDINYDFEWYGRPITLPAGTTLASGRTLSSSETFNVDVYTYYPTMYIRRWVVGDKQWISISDRAFAGAVEISEYYIATFESTMFSPVVDATNQVTNYTIAYNGFGPILRSYVFDRTPLVHGVNNYLINNYGYTNNSGYTVTASVTQSQMMTWASNLTKAWRASALYGSTYKCTSLAQGENYTRFVYDILYLVKYANNNSRATIGNGNITTYNTFSASGTSVISSNGTTLSTSSNSSYARYEAARGGGTISVYNASQKGTATYDSTNGYKLSASGYNEAGLNYGYNCTYTFRNHKQGVYTNQFLTYNTGTTRYLLDGYVGSANYTSVFCLGLANPWGNVATWLYGSSIISDGTNLHAYINFDDYDYTSSSTWLLTNTGTSFENSKSTLINRGYIEMSYNLPTSNGYYRYSGVSNIYTNTGIEQVICLPTKASGSGSTSTGTCSYYYAPNISATANVFGTLLGGYTADTNTAGVLYYRNSFMATYADTFIGFRAMLR